MFLDNLLKPLKEMNFDETELCIMQPLVIFTPGKLRYIWVRHNDLGDENYHFLIRSPVPLNVSDGKDMLLRCYKDAGGVRTAHQLHFAPLETWDGYTKYLVGLSNKPGKQYPPWFGLEGRLYFISRNW